MMVAARSPPRAERAAIRPRNAVYLTLIGTRLQPTSTKVNIFTDPQFHHFRAHIVTTSKAYMINIIKFATTPQSRIKNTHIIDGPPHI